MTSPRPRRRHRGAAVVDIVLVMVVLVPLVLGVVQLGLVLMVRNTLASAAAEGARHAAALDHDLADGEARTRQQVSGVLAGRFARDVDATVVAVDGRPTVRVTVRASVPPLGLGGFGVPVSVAAHAVEEVP